MRNLKKGDWKMDDEDGTDGIKGKSEMEKEGKVDERIRRMKGGRGNEGWN